MGGGNYGWAYRDTIPEAEKLTRRGNSQVLSLQLTSRVDTEIYVYALSWNPSMHKLMQVIK